MEEYQNQVKRKLNVHNLVMFILLFIAMTLGAILTGVIPPDPVGFLVGLGFTGLMVLIGWWAEWSGLAKYLGWDRG